jgi:enoyl-CoA hydratase/carnithine racemase
VSEEFIQTRIQDGVAIITLLKGVTNAIDGDLVARLSEALSAVESDPEVRALVLTSSSSKFFSIGFNIPSLYPLPRDEFSEFYSAFNRVCMQLYALPKPSVAAIPGHAIAGGCILALCCDRRMIASGRKLMGLNEVKLGVPVPFVAECILRQLVSGRHAREVLEAGEFYPPEQLLAMGLVDGIEPDERLLAAASATARSLGSLPQSAYAAIKRSRLEGVQEQISAKLDARNQLFLDRWFSPEARQLLQAAILKF